MPTIRMGFLYLLLSAYLIWRKRDELAKIPSAPFVWGMIIVLVSAGDAVSG